MAGAVSQAMEMVGWLYSHALHEPAFFSNLQGILQETDRHDTIAGQELQELWPQILDTPLASEQFPRLLLMEDSAGDQLVAVDETAVRIALRAWL